MKDIVVMYHYIGDKENFKGSVPLEEKDFENQIELLSKYYEIVLPEEYNKNTSKPKCILSFDDATKDQYINAFRIMQKKGVPGYFTVMSGPLEDKIIPIFHLVHIVLSNYSDKEIFEMLMSKFHIENIHERSSYYSYEQDIFRRYNKYILNFILSEKESRLILEKLVIEKFGNLDTIINNYYMSINDLIKIKNAGMTIGVHCVNHLAYNGDPLSFYNLEIEPCKRFIYEKLHINPIWYTPAFGGGDQKQLMKEQLEYLLRVNNFKGVFTTNKGFNNGLADYWINRVDCNDKHFFENLRWK
ncbi:polysaccharide deacetylase [Lysinibacillus sp. M3]|uniref:Polysaccharide deacetylase n=1 Tax=Lysinibacillus zambalensis TaxID=3160866 RepID=A0ABV1MWE8_9BACI